MKVYFCFGNVTLSFNSVKRIGMAHAQFMSNQPRHWPEFPTLLQVAFSRSVTEGVNDSK